MFYFKYFGDNSLEQTVSKDLFDFKHFGDNSLELKS